MGVAFTTKERVKARRGLSGTTEDAVIDELIAEVSDFGEQFLNRHTLEVQRTGEVYELPAGNRYLWLRGFPIVSVTSVKYATTRSFGQVDALPTDSYDAIVETGELYFYPEAFARWTSPGFVEVSYRGGMAVDTAAFMAAYPSIAGAATAEVINRYNRRFGPEGNLKSLDTGIAFEKPIEALKLFTDALCARRRILL